MGLRGALRSGDGVRNFLRHAGQGGDGVKKNSCGVGTKIPSFGPALPHCQWHLAYVWPKLINSVFVYTFLKFYFFLLFQSTYIFVKKRSINIF